MTIDLSLDSRLFIRNELDAGVQELDLLLNTTNTELINYPQFGTDFDQFLWQLNPSYSMGHMLQTVTYHTLLLQHMFALSPLIGF